MYSSLRNVLEFWRLRAPVPRMLLMPFVIAVLLGQPPTALATGPRPPLLTAQVVQAPDPMIAFGKVYLVYELVLTSFDSRPIEFTNLRVTDTDNPDTTFSFSGPDLAKMVSPVGADAGVSSTSFQSGQVRFVYVWLPFSAADSVPRRISHFLQCRVGSAPGEIYEVALPPMIVGQAPPLSIGPPLRGGDWIAEGGPSND